jgi:hypothetical protein
MVTSAEIVLIRDIVFSQKKERYSQAKWLDALICFSNKTLDLHCYGTKLVYINTKSHRLLDIPKNFRLFVNFIMTIFCFLLLYSNRLPKCCNKRTPEGLSSKAQVHTKH